MFVSIALYSSLILNSSAVVLVVWCSVHFSMGILPYIHPFV